MRPTVAVPAEGTPLLRRSVNNSNEPLTTTTTIVNDGDETTVATRSNVLEYDPFDGDSGERRSRGDGNEYVIGKKWLISFAIYAAIITLLLLLQQHRLRTALATLPGTGIRL
jgi:hypothetical protein